MKLVVSVLLSMAIGAFSVVRQPPETPQKRQFIGYSNSVAHETPNYPDQTAQSSVKVSFSPNQIDQRQPVYNPHYLSQQDVTKNYPTNAPQSQLFNVGYSVQFTNGNKAKPSPLPKYPRINNLDEGEIITGTRKQNEQVRGPNLNLSPQDYVSAALISRKKQKVSGIKPKPQYFASYPNPKTLLNQANLSPITQKYYKTLEQAKPQIQNVQDLQQRYSWRNLSPGVEIIRSTEVPTANQKYTRSEQSLHFDHIKALGRSQDFDYTNAVDGSNNIPQQTSHYYNTQKKVHTLPPRMLSLQQIQSMALSKMNQNVPKLPLDTTLLKEPVQIDTRFVEEAMKGQQLALYTNNQFSQAQEPLQTNSYLQQTYRTIPVYENTQNKPNEGAYQPEQTLNYPDYQPDQTQFADYQPDQTRFHDYQQDQNRFQYKIYGNPQPIGAFNERQSEQMQRQPRYLSDLSNLSTNLRPPPFATVPYQRRILVG